MHGFYEYYITLRFRRDLRRNPAFSSSILPRSASSIKMHPRRPEDMQSFQKLVYPCGKIISDCTKDLSAFNTVQETEYWNYVKKHNHLGHLKPSVCKVLSNALVFHFKSSTLFHHNSLANKSKSPCYHMSTVESRFFFGLIRKKNYHERL